MLRSSALLLALLWLAAPASADPLDSAKDAGQVGEAVDGYLHLVDSNAPADVKALVVEINEKRKAKYQSIATQRGVSLAEVAALAGAKLVERTPAGQYVLDATGSWKKK